MCTSLRLSPCIHIYIYIFNFIHIHQRTAKAQLLTLDTRQPKIITSMLGASCCCLILLVLSGTSVSNGQQLSNNRRVDSQLSPASSVLQPLVRHARAAAGPLDSINGTSQDSGDQGGAPQFIGSPPNPDDDGDNENLLQVDLRQGEPDLNVEQLSAEQHGDLSPRFGPASQAKPAAKSPAKSPAKPPAKPQASSPKPKPTTATKKPTTTTTTVSPYIVIKVVSIEPKNDTALLPSTSLERYVNDTIDSRLRISNLILWICATTSLIAVFAAIIAMVLYLCSAKNRGHNSVSQVHLEDSNVDRDKHRTSQAPGANRGQVDSPAPMSDAFGAVSDQGTSSPTNHTNYVQNSRATKVTRSNKPNY